MNWAILSDKIIICAWIIVMLATDLVIPAQRKALLWKIALCGVGLAVFSSIIQPYAPGTNFQEMLVSDSFSAFFKILFFLAVAVVIVMTKAFTRHLFDSLGAFYMLLFTALLGMLVLSEVSNLLMLFIGIELLTFSLYVMAAYLKADPRSVEAGMKYLILGAVSSGFLIYGIALLYGFAGTVSFAGIRAMLAQNPATLSARIGMLFILAGLGFKIAAVPFHLWVPDVYEGAPIPVVALLSVGSKMAGVVAILRVFYGMLGGQDWLWAGLLALLAGATILYGNLGALPQTNIKRLLGYSSIGHAGYLMMGLSAASQSGMHGVEYYLLAYLFSDLTVFLVVATATDAIGGEAIDDYKGLSKRSGILAGAMFLGLLSLAGVPPLAGFVGKLLVLLAAAESNLMWLVVVGAVSVAISLYYYLMIVKRMYLDAPRTTKPIHVDRITKITLAVLVLGILVIGIVQQPFLSLISATVP